MTSSRKQLLDKSIEIILNNQSEFGSFPASPTFPHFRYCWLRDGVFTAQGILVNGYIKETRDFYIWANDAIYRQRNTLSSLKEKIKNQESLEETDFLPARFTMDGFVEKAVTDNIPFFYEMWPEIYSLEGVSEGNKWPNFQTDCYGTWLWGLCSYVSVSGDTEMLDICKDTIELVLEYLKLTWKMPCFDPWEEHGHERSIGSMGSVAGGLIAINKYYNRQDISALIEEIRTELRNSVTTDGFLPKYIGSELIDGNSMWLFVPYDVFPLSDDIAKKTIEEVESKLRKGGVKRYTTDLYFGGGEWIVLTCWLSWIKSKMGDTADAAILLDWCESHTEEGNLFPEQAFENLNRPDTIEIWKTKWWSKSPAPLLWSHGMFLIANSELEKALSAK